jgi:hypothetical protein
LSKILSISGNGSKIFGKDWTKAEDLPDCSGVPSIAGSTLIQLIELHTLNQGERVKAALSNSNVYQ